MPSEHSNKSAAPVGRDIFAWGSVILAAFFASFYVCGLPMADVDTRTHVAFALAGIAYSAGALIVLVERLAEAASKARLTGARPETTATPDWSAATQV